MREFFKFGTNVLGYKDELIGFLVAKGQDDLTKPIFAHNASIHMQVMTKIKYIIG